MKQNNSIMVGSIAAAAFILGLGGGYFIGNNLGHEAGLVQGVAQEKAAEAERKQAAEREAATAVNPFNQGSANPFEKNSANPFEDVKTNPFE